MRYRAKGFENARRAQTSLYPQEFDISFDSMRAKPNENFAEVEAWTPYDPNGFLLIGTVGAGKSMLCKALINRWATNEYRAIFVSIGDVLDKLRATFKPDADTDLETEVRRYETTNLLILDDLGTEKTTEFAAEKLFRIFEARIRTGRHTFFTSNLTPAELRAKYGDRIYDRITGHCIPLVFRSGSYRSSKPTFVDAD